jgi:hypothetical protein
MSPAEAAYRGVEQLKRLVDRWRPASWSAFGLFEGDVRGLPGLEAGSPSAEFRSTLAREALATMDGRFCFFGRSWPIGPDAAPWWDDEIWLTDPVSGTLWPGAEAFAFDVSYRTGAREWGDVKFVWELNRLQVLPPLALHARLNDDPPAAEAVFHILRGWMRANPAGRGVNWASGIEAASRVVSLLAALAFVHPATAQDQADIRAFLDAHVRWIARHPSRFSSANNHRVAELTALYLAHLCAPGLPGSAILARRAQRGLEREMMRQVHPDGVGVEQSVAYAAYSLEWFTLVGAVGDAVGRPLSAAFRDRARSLLKHVQWLMDDAGQTPRIGDSDDSRVLALTHAPERTYVLSVAAMAARWLSAPGPAPDPAEPTLRDLIGAPTASAPTPMGRKTFPQGGQTVWRRAHSAGGLRLVFDHGPLGYRSIAAHGHADALAVWLHWGAEAVLADPGTHFYHADGPLRDALRGTAAHNTLAVAGENQSRIIGPFAWSRHAHTRLIQAAEDAVEAEQDGYRRRFGVIHRRRVRFEGDVILIEDRLIGRPPRGPLPWSLGFTLAPGVVADVRGPRADLRTPAGRRLSLICETPGGAAAPWRSIRTPYAPSFASLCETTRIERSGILADEPLVSRVRIVLER